ncbi:MAG: cation-translocating P-type ATPase [Clostridia bacterium]|nr:cation-translocating P-type ATPase [Clostridia bacterium]
MSDNRKKKNAKRRTQPPRLNYDAEISDIISGKALRNDSPDTEKKAEIVLPRETEEDIKLDVNDERRFIKTGETPFVSVRSDRIAAEEDTEITGFADRLVTPAAQKRVHTGFTGKLNTYETLHAADGSRRMITPTAPPEAREEDNGAQNAAEGPETPSLFSDFLEAKKDAAVLTEASLRQGGAGQTGETAVSDVDIGQMTFFPEDIVPDEAPAGAAEEEKAPAAPEAPQQPLYYAEFDDIGDGADKDADGEPAGASVEDKGSLLRELAGTAQEDVRRNPDQMMMEGFNTAQLPKVSPAEDAFFDIEEAPPADPDKKEAPAGSAAEGSAPADGTDELERELKKSRQKLINDFHFWDTSEKTFEDTEDEKLPADKNRKKKNLPDFLRDVRGRFLHVGTPFTPVDTDEYTPASSHREIFTRLLELDRLVQVKMAVLGVLGLLLLIIDLLVRISAKNNNGYFHMFGGSYVLYGAINLVFVLGGAGILFPDLKNGVVSLLKAQPKTDTALLFMLAATTLQSFGAMFTKLPLEGTIHLLAPAALILCVPYFLAKHFYYDNARQCFKVLSANGEKSYLRSVADKAFTARLLRNKQNEGNVVYAGKTKFISGFLAKSANAAISGMTRSRFVLISAAVSFVIAVLALILSKSFVVFLTIGTLCLICSFPVSCLAVSGIFIARENRNLSVKSSYVLSYADADSLSGIDNIAVDAGELFQVRLTGCMTADGVSENQARFAAASLASKSDSLLRKAFREAIRSFGTMLPQAEDFTYEDRLGLSAWINGNRVLLGNEALLTNHNVELPDKEKVAAMLKNGAQPIYLAIEGHFAALFTAVYTPIPNVRRGIHDLTAGHAGLLISTTDANITEAFAERLLKLAPGSVRIVSYTDGQKLNTARHTVKESENTGIVFTEAFDSLCRCASAAAKLARIRMMSRTICTVCGFILLAVVAVLTLTEKYTDIDSFLPILLQALVCGACLAAPLIMYRGEPSAPDGGMPQPAAPSYEEEEEDLEAKYRRRYEELSARAAESQNPPVIPEKEEETEGNGADPAFEKIEEPTDDLFSKTTKDALDSFADTPAERARQRARQARKEKEERERPRPDGSLITSESMRKTFSELDSYVEDLAGSKNFGDGKTRTDFSLFTTESQRRRVSAEDIENDYERRRAEEKAVRDTFTAPEIPDLPDTEKDDVWEDAYESIEIPEDVPPAGTVDVFDDALFSRFEDDAIFSGLQEEESKRKIDF